MDSTQEKDTMRQMCPGDGVIISKQFFLSNSSFKRFHCSRGHNFDKKFHQNVFPKTSVHTMVYDKHIILLCDNKPYRIDI